MHDMLKKINCLKRPYNQYLLFLILAIVFNNKCFAQNGVAINTTGVAADSSAMLDVSSTKGGMLVPRMTNNQKNAIDAPAKGLLIYQTNGASGFYFYNGSGWEPLASSVLGQSAVTVYGTGSAYLGSSANADTPIPGLSASITVPSTGNYYMYIATDGGIQTLSSFSGGYSVCYITLKIDGFLVPEGGFKQLSVLNNEALGSNINYWSISLSKPVSAGNHTIEVSAQYQSGDDVVVGSDNQYLLQPELTVMILKQ